MIKSLGIVDCKVDGYKAPHKAFCNYPCVRRSRSKFQHMAHKIGDIATCIENENSEPAFVSVFRSELPRKKSMVFSAKLSLKYSNSLHGFILCCEREKFDS
jgi:hypothetical protein